IDFAIRESVDGVVIAGDLFDGCQIPFHGEAGVLNMIEKLEESGIHLFYTTGNHDPYQQNGFFEALGRYPHVHLFHSRLPEVVKVTTRTGENFAVVSAGHDGPAVKENVIKHFPPKETGMVFVGIGHTMVASVAGSVDHANYMPCSLEDLKSKNYDYFALGHIHKAMALDDEGRIRYAGNIQGRHINETGEKGGWLIEIDEKRFKSEFVPFHDVVWHQMTVELTAQEETMYDLSRKLKESLLEDMSGSSGQKIYRIHLTGETPLYQRLQSEENIEELEESLQSIDGILEARVKTGNLQPVVDREELKQGEHFLGAFLTAYDQNRLPLEATLSAADFISDKAVKDRKTFIDDTLDQLDDMLIRRMKKQVQK
ncbi:MAG: metallophosphoesterase, partial [Clostridia bacterium]|nr:metallophosphoesterase [Clostridia bacterium]